ncbi:riboflavin biosynthesis protein RibD, partial [Cellulomonas septica]|nr:riboflavin biosynthesis protein RibD [Cellulomonas septica]
MTSTATGAPNPPAVPAAAPARAAAPVEIAALRQALLLARRGPRHGPNPRVG